MLGGKMKSLSEDLRLRIVKARARGEDSARVALRYEVTTRTVQKLWKQYCEVGHIRPKQRGGYRRSRLEGHETTLREWIAAAPDITLTELQRRLKEDKGVSIGINALWHGVERLGLTFKKNPARQRARAARHSSAT
jgi:transposase